MLSSNQGFSFQLQIDSSVQLVLKYDTEEQHFLIFQGLNFALCLLFSSSAFTMHRVLEISFNILLLLINSNLLP